MKPSRTFSADPGQRSVGVAGPDQIEQDLDTLFGMFDPSSTGITTENIVDGAVTDAKIGDRTISDTTALGDTPNTGTVTTLLGRLANKIKEIVNGTSWTSAVAINLSNFYQAFLSHKTTLGEHTAGVITNVPSGNISSTTVQTAINELDTEKVNTSEASVAAGANKIPRANNDSKIEYSITGNAAGSDVLLNTHKNSSDHDTHNDARYYTQVNLQTSGQSQVNWDNLINLPNLADSSWKPAVATYNALPITSNTVDDMRVVANDGDGHSAIYRCKAITGTIANQWEKLADLDWTNDHSKLVNLDSDDHLQYHNDTRGDARYYTKTQMQTSGQAKINWDNLDRVPVSINWRAPVATATNLPATDNVQGDTRVVLDTFKIYIWGGNTWRLVTGTGDAPTIAFKNYQHTVTALEAGTTDITLEGGTYRPQSNTLVFFLGGVKQELGAAYTELNNTTIRCTSGLTEGELIDIWWIEDANFALAAHNYLHYPGGGDDISSVYATVNMVNEHQADTMPHAELTNRTITVGSGKDFTTIQAAINSIKKRVDAAITISIDAGTYAENVLIAGFIGSGSIALNGGTDLTAAANFIVQSININQCRIGCLVKGFTATSAIVNNFVSVNSGRVAFLSCNTAATSSLNGFHCESSFVEISLCSVSNHLVGLYAHEMSTVFSDRWTAGSGNTTGIKSIYASTVGKNGSQPQGTTAESAATGGVIR